MNGPCIVGAGAGSGKTRVITHKFAHLVQQYGVNYDSILCITFTNKAAEELKNRVYELIGIPDPFWVRTIHSACLQMIKPYIEAIGLQPNFTITSMSKQKTIVRQVMKDMKIDTRDGAIGKYLTMISRCKDYPNPVKHLEEEYSSIHMGKQVFGAYQDTLRDNNFLDFDDILYHAYWLFRNHQQFHERWTNAFSYILVDEYQDVNNIQYLIIKQLGNNITVVGDDYQAIYAFRGSDPKYFIEFTENYPNAQTFKLEQNYRSANEIVTLSQDIISKNKKQIHKNCFSELPTKVRPKIVHFKDEYQEIGAIVKTCKKYLEDGFNLNDIAILYRIKMSSRIIETEFNRHKIPYKIVNDVSYFERREIKDLMSYMLFLYNFNDSISFTRLMQAPRRGFGDKSVNMVFEAPGNTLLEKIQNSTKMYGGKAFQTLNKVMKMFEHAHSLDFKDVLEYIIKKTDYIGYISSFANDEYDEEERKLNVAELVSMTQHYDSMIEFLEDCALINPDDHIEDTPQITLMTIHAAKGLEFKVVFVIGLEEGTLPHYRSIQESHTASNGKDPIAEERRLFYVACTRAANVLNISRCKRRGWMKDLKISRFVTEIDEELYNNLSILKS